MRAKGMVRIPEREEWKDLRFYYATLNGVRLKFYKFIIPAILHFSTPVTITCPVIVVRGAVICLLPTETGCSLKAEMRHVSVVF